MDDDENTANFDVSTKMNLEDFLKNRGLSDVATYWKEQKIDCGVVLQMSETDLKKLLPKLGDRVAVTGFCKKKSQGQKQSLIEKIKEKMDSNRKRNATTLDKSGQNPKKRVSSTKSTRVVEIGWMCFSRKTKEYKQVRAKCGGGTRRISVGKDIKCTNILEKAKQLFFPNGLSTKGPLDLFQCDLFDFKSHRFDMDLDVQGMYDLSAMTTLRFYLATYPKDGVIIDENDDEYIPSTVTSTNSHHSCALPNEHYNLRSRDVTDPTASLNQDYHDIVSPIIGSENLVFSLHFDDNDQDLMQLQLLQDIANIPENNQNYEEVASGDATNDEVNNSYATNKEAAGEETTNGLGSIEVTREEAAVGTATDAKIKVKLHRGQVFNEIIEQFLEISNLKAEIDFEILLPNGKRELGLDFGGVYRDVLSEFWDTFYEKCTTGYTYKVPVLRHDFNEEKWLSISKIMYKGYIDQNYFPVNLAPAFIEYCLYGSSYSDLTKQFLKYLSQTDSDVVRDALTHFDEADNEELLGILETYDCRWRPDKKNIAEIVNGISHKELIQKPMFVIDNWKIHLNNLVSKEELQRIYEKFNPTIANVLTALIYPNELSSQEVKIISYLKKFIKESDSTKICALLRFCTGSNVLTLEGVRITFNKSEGVTRSPIGHTCGFTLELPATYENYQDFREELNSVLNSNIWVMDFA